MNIIIDDRSKLSLYEQIQSQIKAQILSGDIKPGEMLPSIRTLAKEIKVSIITTKRAYEELEKEGFWKLYRERVLLYLKKSGQNKRDNNVRDRKQA